ncbi:MAG: efflux RND transporter periplasmic adaptor subunit [Bacteroidales bacterium]
MKRIILVWTLFAVGFASCRHESPDGGYDATDSITNDPLPVEVLIVKPEIFTEEVLSNGKVYACRRAELRFLTSGMLAIVNIKNGDFVSSGQVLAELENDVQKIAVARALDRMESARIELNNLLISAGGRQNDSTSVNEKLYRNLKIQSGLNEASNEYKEALLELSKTILKAPFSGFVSGMKFEENNYISPAERFCILLDKTCMKVEFSLTENELSGIAEDSEITVKPFFDRNLVFRGVISVIDPVVNKNGLISAVALLNPQKDLSKLYDGMNVSVTIEKKVPGYIVVPKEALVLRSNREVVFTYHNGRANWNWVKIAG